MTLPQVGQTLTFKNIGTSYVLETDGTAKVFASQVDKDSITQHWKLSAGPANSTEKWAIQSATNGHYLAANGPPGTSSLQLQSGSFFWNILIDTSGDFRFSVPGTPNVVTQVSDTGVDIQSNSTAPNSVEQRWIFSLRN